DPVRPLHRSVQPVQPDPDGLDLGRVGELPGDDGGQRLVGDGAVPAELLTGPAPAPADGGPALLVGAPAVEPRDVVPMRAQRLHPAHVARHDPVHRVVEPRDRAAHTRFSGRVRHPEPPCSRFLSCARPRGPPGPAPPGTGRSGAAPRSRRTPRWRGPPAPGRRPPPPRRAAARRSAGSARTPGPAPRRTEGSGTAPSRGW